MKKRAGLLFLVGGLVLAFFLWRAEQREQHLRFVLGGTGPSVTRLAVDYDGRAGAELAFPDGAPRIVALDPKLPDGAYHLRIDVDRKAGRATIERDVTLSGSTTSIDLVDALR